MAEQNNIELSLSDSIAVLKRRSKTLFLITGAVVLIGIVIAYRVPPLYDSTGVLLSEQAEVPDYVVRSTVPNYPEERARIITQRVLTTDNLERIIAAHELYADQPALEMPAEKLRQFRSRLALSAEDPKLLENIMGTSQAAASVAFSITFSDPSPQVARDVARELVSLYLDENQRARQQQAAETTEFLSQQAARLEEEISEREGLIADFKREHAGSLPELTDMNLQLLDRIEGDIQSVDQEIRSLRERQALYSSELAQLSPHATIVGDEGAPILGPTDRLKVLQRELVRLGAVYSPDHPDVQSVRREIEALSESTGVPAFDRATLESDLAAREDQLAEARDRYSADHPDVQRLERQVASLRDAVSRASTSPAAPPPVTPDNPQYIQRQVQLQATNAELDAALARREDLRERQASLEGRLTATPAIEREYNVLTRGRDQLVAQHSDVQNKLREALIALNLESASMGERFTVLESPSLASSPSRPNRLAVLFLTFIVAGALGAGGVAIAERSDTTVRSPRDVARYLEIPPLVAIPYVYNQADLRSRMRRRLAAATVVCAWAGLAAFFVMTPAG